MTQTYDEFVKTTAWMQKKEDLRRKGLGCKIAFQCGYSATAGPVSAEEAEMRASQASSAPRLLISLAYVKS